MVTQAIKRWLQNLFAWWPWKRSPQSGYAHPVSVMSKGVAQEPMLRTTVEGSIAQPGATSVAVEHADGAASPEQHLSTTEEQAEHFISPPILENQSTHPPTPSQTEKTTTEGATPSPEQQLEFLRYLVQRGLVNEGFERGKEPGQYKKNK